MAVQIDMARKASKRQIALLLELANERTLPPDAKERLIVKCHRHLNDDNEYEMPFEEARTAIRWIFSHTEVRPGVVPNRIRAMPQADVRTQPQPAPRPRRDLVTNPLPTHGVFRLEGEIYIVVPSRRNPGKHYAMKMVKSPNRLTSSGETVNFDYVKAPGVIWLLHEEHRLPPEAVEALMIQHRVCIYPGCGRTLKAAKSVARGAGKVHAQRLGLI